LIPAIPWGCLIALRSTLYALCSVIIQNRQQRPNPHSRAFGHCDLAHNTGGRRRHLGIDLVGGDFEQRLILLDTLARLLEPLPNRPFSHALAKLRHLDIGGHNLLSDED
jgi:hypothetical protein